LRSTRPYDVRIEVGRPIGTWEPIKPDEEGWKAQRLGSFKQKVFDWRQAAAYELFLIPKAMEEASKASKKVATELKQKQLINPTLACDALSLTTMDDWNSETEEDKWSAPVGEVQIPPDDVPSEASTNEIVAKIVSVVESLNKDEQIVRKQPKKEAKLVKQLARLYDKLRLLNDTEEDEPLSDGVEAVQISLPREQYAHLADSEFELLRKTVAEVPTFFKQGKIPGLIKTTRPVVIDVGDALPNSSCYKRLNEAEQRVVDDYVKTGGGLR